MNLSTRKELGDIICNARKGKRISLRKTAIRLGISPTYLCKIEKGVMPASVETLQQISAELDLNSDTLLALAGKINPDLVKIITEGWHMEIAAIIRRTKHMSAEQLCQVIGYMDALKEARAGK